MPTYEYQCPKGHRFELFQKMTDTTRRKCPTCGGIAERRISGGAGLVFKGSGFYITDYGKDGKGARKPEAEPGAEKKPDAKAEAPSAPAAEAKAPKVEPAAGAGKPKGKKAPE